MNFFFPLFLQNTTVENAQSSTPLVINDAVAGEMAVFAVAVSENGLSPILHPVSLSAEADFIPRWDWLSCSLNVFLVGNVKWAYFSCYSLQGNAWDMCETLHPCRTIWHFNIMGDNLLLIFSAKFQGWDIISHKIGQSTFWGQFLVTINKWKTHDCKNHLSPMIFTDGSEII